LADLWAEKRAVLMVGQLDWQWVGLRVEPKAVLKGLLLAVSKAVL